MVESESPLILYIMFQGHRPFSSLEEDFQMLLPYMGMAAILVMFPRHYEQIFVPPPHVGYTYNLVSIGLAVSEEMSFSNVDETQTPMTDDGLLPIL